MECPYCGCEMEAGVIQNQNEISWLKKKHIFAKAEFHEGSVVLAKHSFVSGSTVIANLCRKCEKVVIDYNDNA